MGAMKVEWDLIVSTYSEMRLILLTELWDSRHGQPCCEFVDGPPVHTHSVYLLLSSSRCSN